MMIKNDQDDRNDEHDEYDDELQETVRTLLEMWKKIETVHFFDLYKCHQILFEVVNHRQPFIFLENWATIVSDVSWILSDMNGYANI